MTDDVAIKVDLEQHRSLRVCLSNSWNAFFARFGRLRPIQLAAIPEVASGKDVLITAPTAGGKTEAVVAPVCERLVREKWQGLSCVLVTPTRALVNDLYERLSRPIGEMGIALGRKTSDHAISVGASEQFLITTPESLESLLTFHRARLECLRAIIIDEIHLLDGTARGDQLRLTIQRLRLFLSRLPGRLIPLQMLALSATLPNARNTANRFLGPRSAIVSVVGQRSIESAVLVVAGDDRSRAEATVQASEQFEDVRKMLVFHNSRKAVDASGHYFNTGRFATAALHCHHGSLAKSERERAEERFKQDQFAVCVSTMTLEIGIDIGDVDLVVCMSPPSGICSFLQRIGRGCRRLQGKTRVLCVARHRADELIFEAMIAAADRPIPDGPIIPFRRSVLIQQVLAYLRQVDKHRRTCEQIKRALTDVASPCIDEGMLDTVLRDMCDSELLVMRSGVFEPASRGWEFIQSSRIFSNIEASQKGIQVVDVDTGKQITTAAAMSKDGGNTVRVAGRSFEIVGTHGSKVNVRRNADSILPPEYDSKRFPYAYDVGVSLSARLSGIPGELHAIVVNDKVFVMTWLGKLQNTLLEAAAKKQGIEADAACFSLRLPIAQAPALLSVIQQLVNTAVNTLEVGELPIERVVNLGPYFTEFSIGRQMACRSDWLDRGFLEQWISRIDRIEFVGPSDPRASDLLSLAEVV